MDKSKLIQKLMATFVEELDEHVRSLNRDLLALEHEAAAEARKERLASLFRTAHSLKGASRAVHVEPIESACHRMETVLGEVRDGHASLTPDLFALLFAVADALEEAGMRLREQQDMTDAPIHRVIARLDAAANGEAAAPSLVDAHVERTVDSTIGLRVAPEKLDALLARSGELLVARRRIQARIDDLLQVQEQVDQWRDEAAARGSNPRLTESVGRRGAAGDVAPRLTRLKRDLDRLAGALRSDSRLLEHVAGPLDKDVRRVRMLPFAEACEGLDRLVRDLVQAQKKEIDLIVGGGDVELDRAILEGLKDPLRHLVRNAIDHGIETPEERVAAGKPGRARLSVTASLRGSQVEVAVSDDGRGLDLEAIREQAGRHGIAVAEDERDVSALIFQPGFSTARFITDVSGRGVGLDVVKSRIEALHGMVDWTSKLGHGVAFTLTLPLTLTTLRAVLVEAAGRTYALAGTHVDKLALVGPGDVSSVAGRDVVTLGGAPIPFASLADVLSADSSDNEAPARRPAVIVSAGPRRVAFAVDALLDEQEILVKSLGVRLRRLPLVAGATILASGKIALVLNATNLIQAALRAGSPSRPAAPTGVAPVRKRLLIAEDSVTTRTLEKTILEAAGYDVLTAPDGQAAWELLQTQPFDLLVSDIEMPRRDGFELTRAVRASKALRTLPVVLVTSRENESDKAQGIEAGADAYLVKSAFDQRNLLQTVGQLV